jgi:glycosyltransferase involved in cell wall biosynthesis
MSAVLSIIIVAYRSRGELPACLESLPREIGGGSVEVCVIDNSRDADGTLALLRTAYPWVKAIEPEANLGFGRANNRGLRATQGSIVLFLNPDTVVRPGVLEHLIARVRAEPEIGLISPRLELADGSMDLACRRGIPSLWDGFCRAAGLARGNAELDGVLDEGLHEERRNGPGECGRLDGAIHGEAVFEAETFEREVVVHRLKFAGERDGLLMARIERGAEQIGEEREGLLQPVAVRHHGVERDLPQAGD